MWLCFSDGFISAVQDWNDPTGQSLVVRARTKKDLENIFPNKEITETFNSDYQFRVFSNKQELSETVLKRIEDINYPNFKDSVSDDSLHTMYEKLWRAGLQRQRGY